MKKGVVKSQMDTRGKGFALIVLGTLVLGNIYWFMMSWPVFIGWILVLAGVLKVLMPNK